MTPVNSKGAVDSDVRSAFFILPKRFWKGKGVCTMSQLIVPKGYTSPLSLYETQIAIGSLRRTFEDRLGAALNLRRVSAPLIVDPATGLNDDLNGRGAAGAV